MIARDKIHMDENWNMSAESWGILWSFGFNIQQSTSLTASLPTSLTVFNVIAVILYILLQWNQRLKRQYKSTYPRLPLTLTNFSMTRHLCDPPGLAQKFRQATVAFPISYWKPSGDLPPPRQPAPWGILCESKIFEKWWKWVSWWNLPPKLHHVNLPKKNRSSENIQLGTH